MEIFSHHPLKSCNTFGIEAYAQEFAEVKTDEEVSELIQYHIRDSKKLFFLGGGSNILITVEIAGIVAKISTRGMEVVWEDDDELHLRVAAGEDWDGLVEYCIGRGWGGLENLSGIPGQVGSSPIQNIGAYGTELKDHFVSLEAIDQCTGETAVYHAERCHFDYRDSIFKRALKGRMLITYVVLRLQKHPVINLSYSALKQSLAHLPNDQITIGDVREAVLRIRSSKLPDPKVIGNAGSFFKNPVVSRKILEDLKSRFPGIVYFDVPGVLDSGVPEGSVPGKPPADHHQQPPGEYKLAAGWLIEQCGWKGYRAGDAGVHKDQALVLVNYGHASGNDILYLSFQIYKSVKEKFGIALEREVNVI